MPVSFRIKLIDAEKYQAVAEQLTGRDGPGGGCRAHVDADLDLVVPVALHGGDLRLQQSRGADDQ